ncbi:MAG: pyridoxal phosphate-dependent aminotransferase [Anaerolineales bacterium]|nr:pyridoxal phosphate-dependent aminotransferase [Anaerolineales bacterium]
MTKEIQIHPNVQNIPYGDRKRIMDACQDKKDLVQIASGNPIMEMPPYIVEQLQERFKSGFVPYTNYYGLPELRQKLAVYLKENFAIDADPEEELLITHGVQQGLYIIMRTVLLPGDELIMPSPHYAEYYLNAMACGVKPVLVPLDEKDKFVPDMDRLRDAITPRTKAIVFSNPNNPLGVVWDRQVLEGIAKLAQEHDLLVIVDEIYHDLTFSGEPVSIGSLPGMKERTFTVGGFSKAFMMMGLRIGFVIAPANAMHPIKKLHYCVILTPSFAGEMAALAALDCPKDQLEPMYRDFEERLYMMHFSLVDTPGITCVPPQGGFYMFPNISSFGQSSMDLALTLIDKIGVATLPGTEFGPYGEGYFRLAVCTPREELKEGLDRLRKYADEFFS